MPITNLYAVGELLLPNKKEKAKSTANDIRDVRARIASLL
jgi:hypothetical protein